MKWLTLEQIRKHLRIDDDMTLEDDLLELYGESAEDAVLALLCRSYVNVLLTEAGGSGESIACGPEL